MLETVVVVLLLLWALGTWAPGHIPSIPDVGGVVHVLLLVVIVLVLLKVIRRI